MSWYKDFYNNPLNLELNKNKSYKKYEEDELDLEDIKCIINNVYKTSFVEAVNLSSSTE